MFFIDRQAELAFLSSALERKRPTVAQFILLYGRRRVGKSKNHGWFSCCVARMCTRWRRSRPASRHCSAA